MRNFAPGKSAIALVRKEADTTGWLCPLPADAAQSGPGKGSGTSGTISGTRIASQSRQEVTAVFRGDNESLRGM